MASVTPRREIYEKDFLPPNEVINASRIGKLFALSKDLADSHVSNGQINRLFTVSVGQLCWMGPIHSKFDVNTQRTRYTLHHWHFPKLNVWIVLQTVHVLRNGFELNILVFILKPPNESIEPFIHGIISLCPGYTEFSVN